MNSTNSIELYKHFSAYLEGVTTGVIVLDNVGRIKAYNIRALQMVGIDILDLLEREVGEILISSILLQAIEEVSTGKLNENQIELEMRGRVFRISIKAVKSVINIGNDIVISLDDITEWLKVENLRKEFVENVLFGIRTPLTSIKTALSAKGSETRNENPEILELENIANHEVDRLISLVDNLDDLFFVETGIIHKRMSCYSFELDSVINAVIDDFNKSVSPLNSVKDLLNISGNKSTRVHADFYMLQKVIKNVIKNAVIYCKQKSPIELSIESFQKYVNLKISDKGVGISPEDLPSIFNQFFRVDSNFIRDIEGAGIGLFIAKELIEAMNGAIYCESDVGKGSTFVITVPIAEQIN